MVFVVMLCFTLAFFPLRYSNISFVYVCGVVLSLVRGLHVCTVYHTDERLCTFCNDCYACYRSYLSSPSTPVTSLSVPLNPSMRALMSIDTPNSPPIKGHELLTSQQIKQILKFNPSNGGSPADTVCSCPVLADKHNATRASMLAILLLLYSLIANQSLFHKICKSKNQEI